MCWLDATHIGIATALLSLLTALLNTTRTILEKKSTYFTNLILRF
jgi:hypothetical protein